MSARIRAKLRSWSRPTLVVLVLILIVQGVSTTWIPRHSPNAPLHPDDAAVLRTLPTLIETGRLESPLIAPEGANGQYYVPYRAFISSYANGTLSVKSEPGISGRGVGIFYLAAAAEKVHPGGSAYLMPILGLLLTLAFFLLIAQDHGEKAGLIGAAFIAGTAPFILWSSLLLSNIAALAFFLLGLAALTSRRAPVAAGVLGMASLSIAILVRMEYVLGAVIAGAIILSRFTRSTGDRQKAVTVAAMGLLGLVGLWTIREAIFASGAGGLGFSWVQFKEDWAFHAARREWSLFYDNATHYVWSYALIPSVAALFAIPLLVASPRRFGLGVALLAQGIMSIVLLAGEAGHYGNFVTWLDASHTRYFLPTYASLALIGAVGFATIEWPERLRSWAPWVVLLLVVPGTAQAFDDIHGLEWVAGTRTLYGEVRETAHTLPEDAIIFGNAPSVAIYDRAILSGRTSAIDQLNAQLSQGRPVFVVRQWMFDDEKFRSAEELSRTGHLLMTTPFGHGPSAFLKVERTSVGLDGAFLFNSTEWTHGNGTLTTKASVSTFRVLERIQTTQALGTAGPVKVKVEYLDDAPRTYSGGFINQPFGDDNRRVEFTWEGLGTGDWKTAEFQLPAGEVVNGPYWFSSGLTLRQLRITEVSR